MTTETPQILAIHHIVHEYANFVSSAEMTIYGKDVDGDSFKPPLNTHVSHAFYLNCRKLADFFQNNSKNIDDVVAMHFVVGYSAAKRLPTSRNLRDQINKRLTHLTYYRDKAPKKITAKECEDLYHELQDEWRKFRAKLPPLYVAEFAKKIAERKAPDSEGKLSEFRHYNLD